MADNKSYSELGKEIVSSLTEGLSTGDLSKLNESITNSVDKVLSDVEDKLNVNTSGSSASYDPGSYTRQRQEQLEKERKERIERKKAEEEERRKRIRERNERRRERQEAAARGAAASANKKTALVPFKAVGDVSSVLYTIFGGIGTGVTGIISLVGISAVLGGAAASGLILPGAFLLGFVGMLEGGIYQGKRLKRARRYLQLCGNQQYIEIEKLASSLGVKPKKVVRDLRKMFNAGFFPQGHLDPQNTNFMLTDSVYDQYLQTQKSYAQISNASQDIIDTTAREVVDGDSLSNQQENELNSMIADGNTYIDKLHALNDKIPGEVISAKLDKLEALLKEIFRCVKLHPEQMPRMHELMDYYLPTMIKLVEAYEEYDRISEKGPDIVSAMSDIENTLDTINQAFIKLLNNLFKDSVWDVTTDAQVLKDILVQKGLAQDMEVRD